MTSALHRAWLAEQAAQATTRRIDMPTMTLIAPELRHTSDPAPTRCVTTSTNIVIGGACTRVHPAPRAISGPHRRPGIAARLLGVVGSMRALWVPIGICAAALLLSACSGPSDLEAERDTAAALQDAIAQAQAERPDLWTPETIERAKTAALIAAAGRK